MDIAFEVAVARLAFSDRLGAHPADRWFIGPAWPLDGEAALVTLAVRNELIVDAPRHQPRRRTALRAPMIFLRVGHELRSRQRQLSCVGQTPQLSEPPPTGLSDYCLEHPNTELVPVEDTGGPTCCVCTALRVAELADSWGILGADGQDRNLTKEEFVRSLLAQS
jgi:hypothetical protein